jgi:hypothetical protein
LLSKTQPKNGIVTPSPQIWKRLTAPRAPAQISFFSYNFSPACTRAKAKLR